MPRVPQYQRQVGPVEITRARFRAPETAGGMGAIAEAFQGMAKLADTADKIQLDNDETQARLAVSQARTQYSAALDQFKTLKLGQARAGQEGFNSSLDKIKGDIIKSAATPRQRMMIEQQLTELDGSVRSMGASYALGQAQEETKASFGIEQNALLESAISSDDPAFRDGVGLQIRDSVRRQLQFEGFDPEGAPDAYAIAEKAAVSKLHSGVVDRMFASAEPDTVAIAEYQAAYGDEMTSELRTSIMKRLQGPMQDRQARSDADYYMGLSPPADLGEAPSNAAPSDAPGASRLNAITVQSESGGNPRAVSPKGARGLMQVMPGTARDPGFGIRPSNGTPADDVRVGQEYRAKMEQRYGGDLAKMWAAYNWGPGNLDQAIAKHGDRWLDAAPAETKAYVRKNIAALGAAGGAYAPQPREWSADARQSAYAAIDRDVDAGRISPERGERARKQVDSRFRTDESLLAERQRSANEKARVIALQAGDTFKVSMLPKEVADNLSPVDFAEYGAAERRLAEARAKAAEAERKEAAQVAGKSAEWQLEAQARFDPEGFKNVDLKKFIGVIGGEALNALAIKQTELARKPPKSFAEVDYRGSIQAEINFQDKHNGLKLDDEQKVRMYDFMSASLSQLYQKKGAITKQDVSTIFQSGMRQVPNSGGWFGKSSVPVYELLTDVPDDFRERFTKNWSGNRPPTSGDVVSAYQQWVRGGRR